MLALAEFALPGKRFHFVSNVDGHELAGVLRQLRPQSTFGKPAASGLNTVVGIGNARVKRRYSRSSWRIKRL